MFFHTTDQKSGSMLVRSNVRMTNGCVYSVIIYAKHAYRKGHQHVNKVIKLTETDEYSICHYTLWEFIKEHTGLFNS